MGEVGVWGESTDQKPHSEAMDPAQKPNGLDKANFVVTTALTVVIGFFGYQLTAQGQNAEDLRETVTLTSTLAQNIHTEDTKKELSILWLASLRPHNFEFLLSSVHRQNAFGPHVIAVLDEATMDTAKRLYDREKSSRITAYATLYSGGDCIVAAKAVVAAVNRKRGLDNTETVKEGHRLAMRILRRLPYNLVDRKDFVSAVDVAGKSGTVDGKDPSDEVSTNAMIRDIKLHRPRLSKTCRKQIRHFKKANYIVWTSVRRDE